MPPLVTATEKRLLSGLQIASVSNEDLYVVPVIVLLPDP